MMKIASAATALFLFLLNAWVVAPLARDNGQWEETTPEIRAWYRDLKQPDNYMVSCCGESDAYHADLFEMFCSEKGKDCQYVAIITDTRDIPNRPTIASGTRIVVPNHKLKIDASNPTGHGVIFLSGNLDVYCYVTPSGG